MQNKIGLIVAAIVIILILGVGAFLMMGKSKQASQSTTAMPEAKQEETSQKGSIKGLLAAGKNAMCTFSYSDTQGETSGTIYVSGKKMNGDFTTKTTDGKQMDNHMVQDDTYIYSWSSAIPQGTKMKIPSEEMASPSPASSGAKTEGVDLNKNVDYKCSPWDADNSKFVPPSSVTFMDISSFSKPTSSQSQTAPTTNSPSKSICDQITDPQAKATCLSGY